ncbi:hypothetical protein R5H17_027730 [Pseudomonas aeruginosa]|jgi:hypothetical protein|uniref:hypothetical protein n=1 Tax=Pseudomonas aeruginosa TaxID=287 RepID=UPI002966285D|nr:hypothetical protein [Pseudomonas aeruginosa]MDW2965011.1 hypothetical protein [Pseudomonas aeruginosa]
MSEVKRYIIGRNGLPEFHDSGEYVATSDYDALAAEAQSLREEVEKAQNALAFTEQWHGVRYERLWHWAHAELDEEQKRRYFNIVANGTAEHSEPPTYAQQLCRMKHRYECAEKEFAALRARVVVVPDPVTMDGTTTIREYVANAVPKDTPMDKWTQGYEECKRRIHAMFEQPCNKRPNGLTVSEGLLRRLCEPLLSHANYVVARNELRALFNEDKENGNG